MTEPVTFVAITAATITIPSTANSHTVPGTHLVGAGLLIATRQDTRWRFSSEAATLAAGELEQNLLLWLADRLPMADTLVGWQIDHHLVPALIDAAAHADAEIAHHSMMRLARALRGTVVDLSIDRGGAMAPALSEVAEDAAIASPTLSADTLLGSWGTGHLDAVRSDLAAEAIAIWLLFLREARFTGMEAEEATLAWMRRRRNIYPVKSVPDEA